ncbi:hypothetical protein [Prosthecomicrobium sp. N25]|uniref:hypothetical protein n=1 Tax=Prosthecomicrobium sp. N25 TaxID=3129254 RepID=UPI0030787E95
MRRDWIGAAIALFSIGAAGPAAAQNIGGSYTVRGTNFDGTAYTGTASITLTSNTTCRIVWQTGASASTGICMRTHDSFAAAYVLGNKIGLVLYQIRPDGSLDGTWTIADESGAGTEVLTPR